MEKLFIKFLTIVKSLPLWILIGLSLAGYTLLFLPPISGINFEPLRKTWGSWIWVETIVFSILAITRTLDIIFDFFVSHLAATKQSQILRFVPLDRQVWWHLAKQQDDSFASQIHIEIQVTNTSDRPVQILKVRPVPPPDDILAEFRRSFDTDHISAPIREVPHARGAGAREREVENHHAGEWKMRVRAVALVSHVVTFLSFYAFPVVSKNGHVAQAPRLHSFI